MVFIFFAITAPCNGLKSIESTPQHPVSGDLPQKTSASQQRKAVRNQLSHRFCCFLFEKEIILITLKQTYQGLISPCMIEYNISN
jgi:hypothetical protein